MIVLSRSESQLFCVIVSLLLLYSCASVPFHIDSVSGRDINDCGYPNEPCKTLAFVLRNYANADKFEINVLSSVLEESYNSIPFSIAKNFSLTGTTAAPTTFRIVGMSKYNSSCTDMKSSKNIFEISSSAISFSLSNFIFANQSCLNIMFSHTNTNFTTFYWDSVFISNWNFGRVLSCLDCTINWNRVQIINSLSFGAVLTWNNITMFQLSAVIKNSHFENITSLEVAVPEDEDPYNPIVSLELILYRSHSPITLLYHDSITLDNVIIKECSNNIRNSALFGEGGAIYLKSYFSWIANSQFINNSAYSGGAASFKVVYANVYKTVFSQNSAKKQFGGAIFAKILNLNITESIFSNSVSVLNGGAIFAMRLKSDFIRSAAISKNDTWLQQTFSDLETGRCVISSTVFSENGVQNMTGCSTCNGGALFITLIPHVLISNCIFTKNYAAKAGAVWIENVFESLVVRYSKFISNYALQEGGGLFLKNNFKRSESGIAFAATLHNNDFISNYCDRGCGVFLADLLIVSLDSCNFVNNYAAIDGAGVGIISTSMTILLEPFYTLTAGLIINNCTFDYNIAGLGAALTVTTDCTILNATNNRFSNNFASQVGGAVYTKGLSIVMSYFNTYVNNSAGLSGGCIFAQSALNIVQNRFEKCSCQINGGAIFHNNYQLQMVNATFINNVAITGSGGAIYEADQSIIINSTFIQNRAGSYGGAVLFRNSKQQKVQFSKFFSNVASNSGGVFAADYLSLISFDPPASEFLGVNQALYSGNIFYQLQVNESHSFSLPSAVSDSKETISSVINRIEIVSISTNVVHPASKFSITVKLLDAFNRTVSAYYPDFDVVAVIDTSEVEMTNVLQMGNRFTCRYNTVLQKSNRQYCTVDNIKGTVTFNLQIDKGYVKAIGASIPIKFFIDLQTPPSAHNSLLPGTSLNFDDISASTVANFELAGCPFGEMDSLLPDLSTNGSYYCRRVTCNWLRDYTSNIVTVSLVFAFAMIVAILNLVISFINSINLVRKRLSGNVPSFGIRVLLLVFLCILPAIWTAALIFYFANEVADSPSFKIDNLELGNKILTSIADAFPTLILWLFPIFCSLLLYLFSHLANVHLYILPFKNRWGLIRLVVAFFSFVLFSILGILLVIAFVVIIIGRTGSLNYSMPFNSMFTFVALLALIHLFVIILSISVTIIYFITLKRAAIWNSGTYVSIDEVSGINYYWKRFSKIVDHLFSFYCSPLIILWTLFAFPIPLYFIYSVQVCSTQYFMIFSLINLSTCFLLLSTAIVYIGKVPFKAPKYMQSFDDELSNSLMLNTSSTSSTADFNHLDSVCQLESLLPPNYIIEPENLKLTENIGSGAQATVYLAEYNSVQVAVKICQKNTFGTTNNLKDFITESAALMQYANHPNIIRFLGICDDKERDRISIVTEFCENGSLSNFILSNQISKLSFGGKVKLLLGIASGMQHLHQIPIIHRDLKCENILLDSALTPKIADFGFAKYSRNNSTNLTMSIGTACYIAPEVLTSAGVSKESGKEFAVYDERCDIFSYAIVMYCVLAEVNKPYGNSSDVDIIMKVGKRIKSEEDEYRPTLKHPKVDETLENNQRWYIDLMKQCWSTDPNKRPSFMEIVSILRTKS